MQVSERKVEIAINIILVVILATMIGVKNTTLFLLVISAWYTVGSAILYLEALVCGNPPSRKDQLIAIATPFHCTLIWFLTNEKLLIYGIIPPISIWAALRLSDWLKTRISLRDKK